MGIKDYGCMCIDSAIRMEGSGRRYRAVGICEVNLFNVKCVSVSSIGLKSASYTNPNRSRSTVSRSPLLTDVYHFSWPLGDGISLFRLFHCLISSRLWNQLLINWPTRSANAIPSEFQFHWFFCLWRVFMFCFRCSLRVFWRRWFWLVGHP